MNSLERRIRILEEMMAEIHGIVVLGRKPAPPGLEEYKRAIEAMVDGDMAPMDLYLERGGAVLKADTVFPIAAGQRGRAYAPRRRSAKQPITR